MAAGFSGWFHRFERRKLKRQKVEFSGKKFNFLSL